MDSAKMTQTKKSTVKEGRQYADLAWAGSRKVTNLPIKRTLREGRSVGRPLRKQ